MFGRAGWRGRIIRVRRVESLVGVLGRHREQAQVTGPVLWRSQGILLPELLETDEREEEGHDLTSFPGEDPEVGERREGVHEHEQDAEAVRGVRRSSEL